MACYFRFLLDVDAPLAPPGYGCPSCGFYGPTPGGWIDALDGCPLAAVMVPRLRKKLRSRITSLR